jgi:hypothetical protein
METGDFIREPELASYVSCKKDALDIFKVSVLCRSSLNDLGESREQQRRALIYFISTIKHITARSLSGMKERLKRKSSTCELR